MKDEVRSAIMYISMGEPPRHANVTRIPSLHIPQQSVPHTTHNPQPRSHAALQEKPKETRLRKNTGRFAVLGSSPVAPSELA